MADDEQGERRDAGWTVRLREVESLEPEKDDEWDELYAVGFELSGLGVSGSMTTMVDDPGDVTGTIALALDQTQDGLEWFVRVLARRKGTAAIEPKDG